MPDHPQAATLSPASGAPRVLIVDDHPHIAELIEMRLRLEGFEPTKALGGREAIERLEAKTFDLAILDVMMPDVDGYQVLQHIRASEHTRQLPVIFLSARSSSEDVQHGIRLGADRYLSKPFNASELVRTVKILLEEQKLRRPGEATSQGTPAHG
jgi:DNA-binding response OmpR family regulator